MNNLLCPSPAYLFFLGLWLLLLLNGCSESAMDSALGNEQVEGSVTTVEEESISAIQDPSEKIQEERRALRKWRTVGQWEGSRSQQTPPFEIKGLEWKIRWRVKAGEPEDSEFIVLLQNQNDPDDKEIVAQQIGPGQNDFAFEGGQGTYYLEVKSALPYTIEVVEYR